MSDFARKTIFRASCRYMPAYVQKVLRTTEGCLQGCLSLTLMLKRAHRSARTREEPRPEHGHAFPARTTFRTSSTTQTTLMVSATTSSSAEETSSRGRRSGVCRKRKRGSYRRDSKHRARNDTSAQSRVLATRRGNITLK